MYLFTTQDCWQALEACYDIWADTRQVGPQQYGRCKPLLEDMLRLEEWADKKMEITELSDCIQELGKVREAGYLMERQKRATKAVTLIKTTALHPLAAYALASKHIAERPKLFSWLLQGAWRLHNELELKPGRDFVMLRHYKYLLRDTVDGWNRHCLRIQEPLIDLPPVRPGVRTPPLPKPVVVPAPGPPRPLTPAPMSRPEGIPVRTPAEIITELF